MDTLISLPPVPANRLGRSIRVGGAEGEAAAWEREMSTCGSCFKEIIFVRKSSFFDRSFLEVNFRLLFKGISSSMGPPFLTTSNSWSGVEPGLQGPGFRLTDLTPLSPQALPSSFGLSEGLSHSTLTQVSCAFD